MKTSLDSSTVASLAHALPGGPQMSARLRRIEERHRRLREDPDGCSPCVQILVPVAGEPSPEEQFDDPLLMLKTQLDQLRLSWELGDDRLPAVRVNFGTAMVAHAFGCALAFPTNSLPAAHGPAINDVGEIASLPAPTLASGLYPKLFEWTELWLRHLPEVVRIQHSDIQSAFNTAHLVRGNDIMTDFYDDPSAIETLLAKITDHMIEIVPAFNRAIRNQGGWFADWGAWWQGAARISNCSLHMISPAFYEDHIRVQDDRFFAAVGGGRMHYCGTHGQTIAAMTANPLLSGIDLDPKLHDFWKLAETLPPNVVLCTTYTGARDEFVQRLLRGDWPAKRNLVIYCYCKDMDEGRATLAGLRATMPQEKG